MGGSGFGLGWSDGQESNAHHNLQLAVPAHIPLAPESGDVYQTVGYLRKKLRRDVVETIRGAGYRSAADTWIRSFACLSSSDRPRRSS